MATSVPHHPTNPPPSNDEPGDERGRRPSERTTLHAGPMTALPQRPGVARQTMKKLARPSSGLAEQPASDLAEQSASDLSERPSSGISERASSSISERRSSGISERPSSGISARPSSGISARPSAGRTGRPASARRQTEAAKPHGPTPEELASGAPIRCLVFAPEPNRARWVETELTQANPVVLEGTEPRPKITIQLGRRVRTVVCALVKDPPPRPQVLIVDFDAISAGELFELHAVRHEGWTGRLIGLGDVPPELVTSLEVDHVFTAPFVRDSLLDCVAGTTHAAVTALIPVIPEGQETF